MITTQAIYNPESQIVLWFYNPKYISTIENVRTKIVHFHVFFLGGKQFYSIETKWPHENFMTVF